MIETEGQREEAASRWVGVGVAIAEAMGERQESRAAETRAAV